MEFKKLHGLGNDFIVVDCREKPIQDPAAVSTKICDRHTGVGADGLIMVTQSEKADLGMRIFNSDGSEAEMCGNGIRCYAKYVFEEGITNRTEFTVDTLAGIMQPRLILSGDGCVEAVVVDMGQPSINPGDIPVNTDRESFLEERLSIDGREITASTIGMGVPHTVLYVDAFDGEDYIRRIGKAVENHPVFPCKTNVNFVRIIDRRNIEVRTWERGAGRTLACGTGCCSAVVVSSLLNKTDRVVDVTLALGRLKVEWKDDGRVFMTGPAENVCRGIWLKS
ncbi:MAG: Diaminopimelate epimerase [Firmicutes bacterium]|nr:Diaminopimelate epimerase [Bacillota bacterium]MDI6705465.1 diaminopimelate epimerase [Bacillota bacterium]